MKQRKVLTEEERNQAYKHDMQKFAWVSVLGIATGAVSGFVGTVFAMCITAAVGSESSAVKCGNVEYAHNVIANRLTCVQAKEMLRNWVESGQPIEQLGEWARYEIHPLDVPSYASYVGPGEGRAYVSYEVKM